MSLEIIRPDPTQKIPDFEIPERNQSEIIPTPVESEAVLLNILKERGLQWDESVSFHSGPSRRSGYKLAAWSCVASMIDALLIFALQCLFLIAAVLVDRIHGRQSFMNAPVLGSIAISLIWIYMVSFRCFMRATVGEWACQLQLGKPDDFYSDFYSVKVILRVTLIMCTGYFILPTLSLLLGRDLTGKLVGLPIVQRNY